MVTLHYSIQLFETAILASFLPLTQVPKNSFQRVFFFHEHKRPRQHLPIEFYVSNDIL